MPLLTVIQERKDPATLVICTSLLFVVSMHFHFWQNLFEQIQFELISNRVINSCCGYCVINGKFGRVKRPTPLIFTNRATTLKTLTWALDLNIYFHVGGPKQVSTILDGPEWHRWSLELGSSHLCQFGSIFASIFAIFDFALFPILANFRILDRPYNIPKRVSPQSSRV